MSKPETQQGRGETYKFVFQIDDQSPIVTYRRCFGIEDAKQKMLDGYQGSHITFGAVFNGADECLEYKGEFQQFWNEDQRAEPVF